MIKKITLATVATLALMTLNVQAEGMKCQAEKCGASMAKMDKPQMMQKKHKKGHKKASPFLIKHGLPHLTKILMKNWDDTTLALTAEQKTKLLAVRKETMGGVMRLKPEVMALEKEIIKASRAGAKASELQAKVEKLAKLEAELTMIHLSCIEHTNTVLSDAQQAYLKEKRKANHQKAKAQKANHQKAKAQKAMKCAAGKCASEK